MTPELELARHTIAELIGQPPGWHQQAACRGQGPDAWFRRGAPNSHAIATCRPCPVKTECLNDALAVPMSRGIWGGTTERQRNRIRRNKPCPTNPARPDAD